MKRNNRENLVNVESRLPIGHEDDVYGQPAAEKGIVWAVVPFTTPKLTKAALQQAVLCSDLEVHVALVDVQVVPFPCPLDQPPVDKEYSRCRLEDFISEIGLPGRADVVYTRDWINGFHQALEPNSLVVLSTKARWWPTRERRLARALEKAGHQVVLHQMR